MPLVSYNATANQMPFLFSDEKTKVKIRKHLTDIDDVISEEDIRNIKTDISDKDAKPENVDTIPDEPSTEAKKEKDKEDGNNSNDIGTVWNVID